MKYRVVKVRHTLGCITRPEMGRDTVKPFVFNSDMFAWQVLPWYATIGALVKLSNSMTPWYLRGVML